MTRGDPESPLRWTCKSTRALSTEMFMQYGLSVGDQTIERLLRDRGYSLQATSKTVEGLSILSLIGNTTTIAGLVVRARLDRRKYPIGKKVSAKELSALKIERDGFHGDWNYVVRPRTATH